jgi:hypothetical protein
MTIRQRPPQRAILASRLGRPAETSPGASRTPFSGRPQGNAERTGTLESRALLLAKGKTPGRSVPGSCFRRDTGTLANRSDIQVRAGLHADLTIFAKVAAPSIGREPCAA